MVSSDLKDSFIQLVRLGIGTSKDCKFSNVADWVRLKVLADSHGLSAVVLDGIDKCQSEITSSLSVDLKFAWIGEVFHNYEQRYKQYEKAISGLASFYNAHGYKMMILKGYACSIDWPRPNHRPCGDIDIWQFGQWKDADNILTKEKGISIDNSHHHHTVFDWQGFMVENHYDFINVHHHPSNAAFEKILKEQGQNDTYNVEVNGERVYIPSPNLHALFLLKHACIEFAASVLNLRQLLDWAFFVKSHGKYVDWDWLLNVLEQFGMKTMFDIINAICVADLGFNSNIFPYVQCDPTLKERVLKEILSPTISNKQPRNLIPRIVWKYRRWKANEWKHALCYKESLWSAFLSGIWNHLLKPSSI